MKKKIISLFVLTLILIIANKSLDYLNIHLVDHKEVGRDIHLDEISDDRLTMLHSYSSEVIVNSHIEREVSFVKFGLRSPFNMYINRNIVVQNHMKNYDQYANESYMKYNIKDGDYDECVVRTYLDIVPSEKNKNVTFFVGDEIRINRLIILKSIISFAIVLLLCISLAMSGFANYKNKWFMAFILSFPLLIIDFDIGIIVLSTLMYFSHGSVFNKKYNIYLAGILIAFGILINNSGVIVAILLFVLLYQWFRLDTIKTFTALLSLGLLFSIYLFNDQNSIIELFYKEIRLIPFILYGILMSYKKYICKAETINVEMLRGIKVEKDN